MNRNDEKPDDSTPQNTGVTRRLARDLLIIGGLFGVLYVTGLHTSTIAVIQRAVLQTGLFNARPAEIVDDGPFLSDQDYGFRITSAGGSSFKLNAYRGEVIFINVWASWCPPCRAEMPSINRLHNELGENDGIRFLMLSFDEERASAMEFMERRDFGLPIHFPASPVPEVLRSGYLPTTYVIAPNGQIVYRKEGIADYSSRRFRDWLLSLRDL